MLNKTLSKIHKALIELSDHNFLCQVSYRILAQKTGYCKRTVVYGVKILTIEGFIKKFENTKDNTSTNVFRVCKKFVE